MKMRRGSCGARSDLLKFETWRSVGAPRMRHVVGTGAQVSLHRPSVGEDAAALIARDGAPLPQPSP